MCMKKGEGKRCKYADEMAVIRRRVRRQNPRESFVMMNRLMKEEIEKELLKRPDLALHEAQKNTGFQWTPPSWSIPYSLTKDMHKLGTMPDNIPATQELYDENKEWQENLTESERRALQRYGMVGYEEVNGFLRKTKNWDGESFSSGSPERKAELTERVKKDIKHIESALAKAPRTNRVTPVYRYYKIPNGVSTKEYIDDVLISAGGHKDKGFVSTTAKPEHALAAISKKGETTGLDGYVLMEIWTNQGGSMQRYNHNGGGNVQSQENEVLLPRNTGMRHMETGTMRHTFEEEPVEHKGGISYNRPSIVGRKLSIPVIRMVDEQMIRDERNRVKAKRDDHSES